MFSYARAYAYLLFAESRPASTAAIDPLDSLLTRLVSAPIELLGRLRQQRPAERPVPHLRALAGGRTDARAAVSAGEEFRPAA